MITQICLVLILVINLASLAYIVWATHRPKRGARVSPTIKNLIDRFEQVVRTEEMRGGSDPEEMDEKLRQYQIAREQLERCILFVRGQALNEAIASGEGLFGVYSDPPLDWRRADA